MPVSIDLSQDDSTDSDRRRDPRVPFRTLATGVVFEGAENELTIFRAWSDDISTTGAGLICDHEIQGDRMFLRLLLPGFTRKLIECKVIACRDQRRINLLERREKHFFYGVRFVRVLTESEMTGPLLSSLAQMWHGPAEADADLSDKPAVPADARKG